MQAVTLLRMSEDKHNFPDLLLIGLVLNAENNFFFKYCDELSQCADIGLVYNLPASFVFLLFFHNRMVVISWIFSGMFHLKVEDFLLHLHTEMHFVLLHI
jgi:hypothetical protein